LKSGRLVGVILAFALLAGCSVRRYAISQVGNALSSGKGSVYESDDDIDLVGAALPFGLKLIETLLAEVPNHKGLLQTACQGFATYSYIYVDREADLVEGTDLTRALQLRARAKRLYLRARRYGLRGLEASHRGITGQLDRDPGAALAVVKKKSEVPLLYWNAVALGLAISADKNDAEMLGRIPEVEAFIARARALDETWGEGALQEFQVSFAGSNPAGANYDEVGKFYQRALELSGGKRAGLYVAYAETVWLPRQNKAEFRQLLEKALAVNPDDDESQRLANKVAQERAKWLLDRIDDLILESEPLPNEGKLP